MLLKIIRLFKRLTNLGIGGGKIMKKNLINPGLTILLSCVLMVSIIGCATAPTLSPMQKRQITTRVIEGGYENIFKSTVTVLQDNEYIIKDTKMDTGLILAEVNRESNIWAQVFSSSDGVVHDKGTIIAVSATVDKLNDKSSEVRLTIEEKTYSSAGGTTNVKQIIDEKIYSKLFNDIAIEVKRREAFGR